MMVSSKQGRSSSPTRPHNTTGGAASCPAWFKGLGNLITFQATRFFTVKLKKRKARVKKSCLPFPLNQLINLPVSLNARSRQPTSPSHPTNQDVPGMWMRPPPAGGRGVFTSLEATREPWKTSKLWGWGMSQYKHDPACTNY